MTEYGSACWGSDRYARRVRRPWAIKAAVENGYLKEVDKAKVAEDHNYHGKAYRVLRLDFSRETEESIEARRAAARFWPE